MVELGAIGFASALGLSLIVASAKPHYMHISFYIFCYVFLFMAGTVQILYNAFPLDMRTYNAGTLTATATTLLVGFIAHEVGYILAPNRRKRGVATSFKIPLVRSQFFFIVVVLGIGFSLYAIADNGISPFFDSRSAAARVAFGDSGGPANLSDNKTSGLFISRLIHVPVFVALYIVLWERAARLRAVRRGDIDLSSRISKRFAGSLLFVLVALNVIMNNLLGNSRLWAGLVIFGILATMVELPRPRQIANLTVALLTLYMLVFPYADSFRRSGTGEGGGIELQSPISLLYTDGSFSAFQTTANGIEYLSSADHTWGKQVVGGLLTLIPRSIWESKPIDTGAVIDPQYNRAATLWTEFQVDFGLVGVAILFLVLGAAVARLDGAFQSSADNMMPRLIVPLLAPFYVFLLRGTLSAAMGTLLPLLLFVVLSVRRAAADNVGGSSRTRV